MTTNENDLGGSFWISAPRLARVRSDQMEKIPREAPGERRVTSDRGTRRRHLSRRRFTPDDVETRRTAFLPARDETRDLRSRLRGGREKPLAAVNVPLRRCSRIGFSFRKPASR